jgi:hypothetical protein
MVPKDVDFRRLPRNLAIQALGCHPETFDAWVMKGLPSVEGTGRAAVYDIGKILDWRVEKEKEKKRQEVKAREKKDKESPGDDQESGMKYKISLQELRKKTRENDEADGHLVDRYATDNLFFNLGKNIRLNLIPKAHVYGPQCEGKTGFEIATFLLKEFEKLCNSISGLEGFNFSEEALAYEYHEMFMKGFEYAKKEQAEERKVY